MNVATQTTPPRPHVEELSEALARASAILTEPETLRRLEWSIKRRLRTTYELEVHWSAKNGLCVELNFRTGSEGQVVFFGNLAGPQPEEGAR